MSYAQFVADAGTRRPFGLARPPAAEHSFGRTRMPSGSAPRTNTPFRGGPVSGTPVVDAAASRRTETVAIVGDGVVADLIGQRAQQAGWHSERVALYGNTGTSLAEHSPAAVREASIVVVATAVSAHPTLSVLLTDCLRPGALVVLLPGAPGAAAELAAAAAHHVADVTVAETSWSPWQLSDHGTPIEAGAVPIASVPAGAADSVSARLAPLFASTAVPDTAWTALHSPDVVVRTVPALLHAARHDYATLGAALDDPSVAALVTELEDERQAMASALGLSVPRVLPWLAKTLGTSAESLSAALGPLSRASITQSPNGIDLIPYGLVPTLGLAVQAGVDAPLIRGLIETADDLLGNDYLLGGRSTVHTEVRVTLKSQAPQ